MYITIRKVKYYILLIYCKKGSVIIIKKVVLLIVVFFFIITNYTIFFTNAVFRSLDTNRNNFISIGEGDKNIQYPEISSMLFATVGPRLTYSIDIPRPHDNIYNFWKRLDEVPYYAWSIEKNNEIINIIKTASNGEPTNSLNFITKDNKDYLKNNSIVFDGNESTGFSSNQGLHLFVAICNNAHLVDRPKRINISKDRLLVDAIVKFKGETTGRVWNTHFNDQVDLLHNRYYVTHAYYYDRSTKTYKELTRGRWRFSTDADLIITNLGITGYVETKGNNWKVMNPTTGQYKHKLLDKMLIPHNNKVDNHARVIKANYRVYFIPEWDANKKIRRLLNIGK